MACKVGMTTDLAARKSYWMGQHPTLHNWIILGTYSSKSAAQAAEIREAARFGCQAYQGGDGPEYATWYVYGFNYSA